MCFSAQASFTAAAICGTIGVASVLRCARKHLMLALVPLLFGLHQAIEGVVWLHAGQDVGQLAGLLFVGIAFCFWPTYIPLSTLPLAPMGVRRNAILAILLAGIFVSLYAAFILTYPLIIDFSSHKVHYITTKVGANWVGYLYVLAVTAPLVLMRNRYLKLFGLLVFIFLAISLLFFVPAQFSVWCFFSAASSVLVFLAVKKLDSPIDATV
jgi:hypothetical protein